MTTITDLLAQAESHQCSIEVRGTKLRWRAPTQPPIELLDRLRERKFDIIEHLQRVPAEWVAGAAAIESMPAPDGWPEPHWGKTVLGAVRFVDTWGSQAHALGWTTIELFGCHPGNPYSRFDQLGLALLYTTEGVSVFTEQSARFSQTTFYRKQPQLLIHAVAIWEV